MRWTEDAGWTTAFGFKTRHAGANAVFFGDSIGGNHDAIAFASATDPDRTFLQFRIEGDFTARKKAVAINVQDAVGWSHVAPPTLICQPHFPRKQVENSYSQGQPMSNLFLTLPHMMKLLKLSSLSLEMEAALPSLKAQRTLAQSCEVDSPVWIELPWVHAYKMNSYPASIATMPEKCRGVIVLH
jgi:hypothetical protein